MTSTAFSHLNPICKKKQHRQKTLSSDKRRVYKNCVQGKSLYLYPPCPKLSKEVSCGAAPNLLHWYPSLEATPAGATTPAPTRSRQYTDTMRCTRQSAGVCEAYPNQVQNARSDLFSQEIEAHSDFRKKQETWAKKQTQLKLGDKMRHTPIRKCRTAPNSQETKGIRASVAIRNNRHFGDLYRGKCQMQQDIR